MLLPPRNLGSDLGALMSALPPPAGTHGGVFCPLLGTRRLVPSSDRCWACRGNTCAKFIGLFLIRLESSYVLIANVVQYV